MNVELSASRYTDRLEASTPLERDEELELTRRYVTSRDPLARGRLVQSQLRYVVAVARKYRRSGVLLDDLIAEGNLGLLTALERFDPERGYRFLTYAKFWVRAYMLAFVMRSQTGDESSDELIDKLPSPEQDAEQAVSDGDASRSIADAVRQSLMTLDPRERFVVEHRLMADRDAALTLAEVGRKLGVSRERARQLEARAKGRLSVHLAPFAHG